MATLQGVVHGKIIELEREPGLPDGQAVSVAIEPLVPKARPAGSAPPWWLERLDIDPAVKLGKWVIKGTQLLADTLLEELEAGPSDAELLRAHPELTAQDLAALREYAKLPVEMRRVFGAWAEDADELDQFLQARRQLRRIPRREVG